jgi:hypothetical protein
MSDSLGPITIPEPLVIEPFPLTVDYGSGQESPDRIIAHLTDQPGLHMEQRFWLGDGARRFRVSKVNISCEEYDELKTHWLDAQGIAAEFDYSHPVVNDVFETYRVRYGDPTLTLSHLADMVTSDPGLLLVEVPQATPTHTVTSVLERFPDLTLDDKLHDAVQRVIPIIRITPHGEPGEEAPPQTIYLSDRRLELVNTIEPEDSEHPDAPKVYLPRLVNWSGISQSLGENSDSAQLVFGNADRVWFDYCNQVELTRATVNFWLYFENVLAPNTGTLLKLWTGYIQGIKFNEDENLELDVADGVYELNLAYPVRQVSRTCWKIFADGMWCPYSDAHIDPDTGTTKPGFTSCPKTWEACQERGMTRHFGGFESNAGTVKLTSVKGAWWMVGSGRHSLTSATVTNDTVYEQVLQEVYNDTDRLQLPPATYERLRAEQAERLAAKRAAPRAPAPIDGPEWEPVVPLTFKGPEIPVPAQVAMGRDDNEFYAAIGVVGEGPITAFGTDVMQYKLDNSVPLDPEKNAGYRTASGHDPVDADSHDFLYINHKPWGWPVTAKTATPELPEGTRYPPGSKFAAGTAFVEIRRTDEKGIQASKISDRTMQVPVAKGIGGWIWKGVGGDADSFPTGPYTREWSSTLVAGVFTPAPLTNPVWVAINVYLKALGLKSDYVHDTVDNPSPITQEMQEAVFDIESAVNAAFVCDKEVSPMTGAIDPDQKEWQFRFRGILAEQKPVRDWLQEILNSCLGYYTFRNGKLKIGIRFHSGTSTGLPQSGTFTVANILHRSLQAEPVVAKFNLLSGEFGDEEFQWQANRVITYDIDHARAFGSLVSPRYIQSHMTFVGVSSKSQCGRLVVTRLREELGGATREEQRNARNISLRTTVMALGIDPGKVCSLDHPRMPNEDQRVEFRVVSWRLNPDWSVDISGSSTCDHMYDYTFGPKPGDDRADPVPAEMFDHPIGMAWLPNEIAPFADDPILKPTELTFALRQNYPIEAEGTYSPAVIVRGELPITRALSGDSPVIRGIEYETTGGHLKGGQTYYAVVAQRDDTVAPTRNDVGGEFAPPSNYVGIWIPKGDGSDTNKVILDHIRWPQAMPGYGLWAGNEVRSLSQQISDSDTPLPEVIEITGPLAIRTRGAPNPRAKNVRIKAREVYHSGVAGIQVMSVAAPNLIQSDELKGSDDPWVGQVLSVIADASDLDVPLWNFSIGSFNSTTGTFVVFPNCVGVPTPDGGSDSVQAGDVMIVRSRPTSWTKDTITNTLWANDVGTSQFNAVDGLIPDYEVGLTLMVIAGTGKGQVREIIANDNITHTVKPDWDVDLEGNIQIDETSVYIITWSDWPYQGDSNALDVLAENQRIEIVTRVTNSTDQTILVGGFLIDKQNRPTLEDVACYREIYVYGEPYHVRTATEDTTTEKVETNLLDQTVRVDTTDGDQEVELLRVEPYFGRKMLIVNDGTGDTPGRVIIKPHVDDEFQTGVEEIILVNPGDWAEFIAAGDREETRLDPSPALKQRRSSSWHRRKQILREQAARDKAAGRTASDVSAAGVRRKGLGGPPDRKGQL